MDEVFNRSADVMVIRNKVFSTLLIIIIMLIYDVIVDTSKPITFLIGLSTYLLFIGFLQKDKQKDSLTLVFYTLSFLVVCLALLYFVSNYFTGDGITQQSLDHFTIDSLETSLDGLSDYHYWTIFLFVNFFVLLFLCKPSIQIPRSNEINSLFIVLFALIVHPASYDIGRLYYYKVAYDGVDTDIAMQFKSGQVSNSEIENISSSLKTKNDIFLIYLESFEEIYSNEKLYPGLTPNINRFIRNGQNFGDLYPGYGASHTIAGLVSVLCGVPYATGSGGKNMVHNNKSYFMPNVQCLSDVTDQLGYKNIFYQGGSLDFTSKRALFSAHNYHELKGLANWIKEKPDNLRRTNWGINDDILFKHIYERITELKANKTSFLMTTLTLDTHDPFSKKRMSASCETTGKDHYPGGYKDHVIQDQVHCSDSLLGEFIDKLNKDFNNSIDIYLVSDHLAHSHSQGKKFKGKEDRELHFIKVGDKNKIDAHRTFTHFDIAASILDNITDGKIQNFNMGVSLYSKEPTLIEKFGDINSKFRASMSQLAKTFWNYPSFKNSDLSISIKNNSVTIGERIFPLRTTFALDLSGNIVDFYSGDAYPYIRDSKRFSRTVQVSNCGLLNRYEINSFPESSFCLLIGNIGSEEMFIEKLHGEHLYKYSDYIKYLDMNYDNDLFNSRIYEYNERRFNKMKSSSTNSISPLGSVQFLIDQEDNLKRVLNYYNETNIDKHKGWKNHNVSNLKGFHLFSISKGVVKLVNTWSNCDTTDITLLSEVLSNNRDNEFILMTANEDTECNISPVFTDTVFYKDVSNSKLGEPYIGYYDRANNKYTSVKGDVGDSIYFRLVDSEIYNKRH